MRLWNLGTGTLPSQHTEVTLPQNGRIHMSFPQHRNLPDRGIETQACKAMKQQHF